MRDASKELLRLQINGETHEFAVPPHWTLLEALRYELRLTGSKQGCDKGDCGACTVLIDGQAELACCTLAMATEGREIQTIEGMAKGPELDPIQRAFDVSGALQCGFCQPGMMLAARALLDRNPDPTDAEIQDALSSNLCRCTGYTKIIEAVRRAASGELDAGESTAPEPGAPAPEALPYVGVRAKKVDGWKKATGEAIYTDDIQLPRMLHAKILRSPHPHARIVKVDTSRAEALPGVHAVLTGDELPERYCIIPWTRDEQAIAADKARYIGDAVAAVAAIDEDTANEALTLIDVEYELLEPILSIDDALDCPEDNPARRIHDRTKVGNVAKRVKLEFGEVDAAIDGAAAQVEDTWFYEGSTHAPIEPHCAIGHFDADGLLTVWSSTQVPHYLHRELATVLDLPQRRIRVIQPYLGGAFGGKSEPFDLEFCVARLSQKTGRPVKILYTREEVFYSHRGRHPMRMHFRIGADAEGKLTGVRSKIHLDGGAYMSFGLVTAYYAGQLLTGPTHFPTYAFDATRLYTNKPACGPKRGHGSVQPRFAFECALDAVAEKLEMDPIELRRRNINEAQSRTVNGQLITSIGFAGCLDAVERASDWKERRGQLPFGRGLGVAGSMYISGTAYPIYPNDMPQSGVQLKVDRSGRVTVYCGASDIGQGSDTLLMQVVAAELGVEPGDVLVISSDTDLTPVDLGAYSSRGTFMVGNAAIQAARRMRGIVFEAVAESWEIPASRLAAVGGVVYDSQDTARRIEVREAFQLAEARSGTLGSTGSFWTEKLGGDYRGGTIGASPAYSFTAHVADVEVNPDTGEVDVKKIWVAHDCGRAINPTLVEGQMEGSAYMGFAEALMEEQIFYREGPAQGLHKGPSLLDYRIPTTLDTPELEALIIESHDPKGPYGAKEAGEGPLHPSIPAIANAIYDAVGVRVTSLPFHPGKILAALRAKASGEKEAVAC